MEQKSNSRCRIVRQGTVVAMSELAITLEVEGKKVDVPRSKVDPQVQLGDKVVWTSGAWKKV